MNNKVTLLNREFRLGIGFLNLLIDGTGKDLSVLAKEATVNPVSIVPKMIYYSLLYSYQRDAKEIDFNQEDIYDWIDDNGGIKGSFFNDFLIAFAKSMNQDVPADDKKKVVKTKK